MTHPDRKVNPELVLEAWKIVCPEFAKAQGAVKARLFDTTGIEVLRGYAIVAIFDPLKSDSDAMKLERALKQRGNGWWSFFVNALGLYMASSAEGPCKSQYDESDTLLLLKCVSAQTGIALWVEGEKSQ
jgi:hypothetical protein